jgi:hypothetical protein
VFWTRARARARARVCVCVYSCTGVSSEVVVGAYAAAVRDILDVTYVHAISCGTNALQCLVVQLHVCTIA